MGVCKSSQPPAAVGAFDLPFRRLFTSLLIATLGALAACAAKQPGGGPRTTRQAAPPPVTVTVPAARESGETTESPVCYDCFWEYQPEGFRAELARWYEKHPQDDPLADADRRYLLARVEKSRVALCEARRAFEALRPSIVDLDRRLLVEETLAFTAPECGGDVAGAFGRAAGAAEMAGDLFKARLYEDLALRRFAPVFGETEIETRLEAPAGATGFVLGESVIRVSAGERIGVQVERTVRDWLSYQLSWDLSRRAPGHDELIPWHEGARLREVLEEVPARIVPLPGTIAMRSGERWFAPDENGVFRFEVLPDKIDYPTTRAMGNVALLVDTHGLASLVGPALWAGVPLVVGCCDTPYKAQAAYWLASHGVDVYFPCDRYVGSLLGYQGRGTLIGSAPVRGESGVAVIGDRPVRFSASETIVVEDARLPGPLQYYDAPGKYFHRLAEALPMKVEFVNVTGPGQASAIVGRAEELGAAAIAVRVWNEEDAAPVRMWLRASPAHRAVLFHSAPYPAGNALFSEFPKQTTFGDPRPHFLVD
jgi:hypothetical protein